MLRSSPQRWPNKPGKNVRPSIRTSIRTSTMKLNAATNNIVEFVRGRWDIHDDMTFKVIWGQGQGQEMTSVPFRDYFCKFETPNVFTLVFFMFIFIIIIIIWQPSDCVHLMVMIVLCCSRKINMMMVMISCDGRCRSYKRAPCLSILHSVIGSCQTNVEWTCQIWFNGSEPGVAWSSFKPRRVRVSSSSSS